MCSGSEAGSYLRLIDLWVEIPEGVVAAAVEDARRSLLVRAKVAAAVAGDIKVYAP